MSKILRRPMFRKGGAVEKGIGSMMPRKKYQEGSEYTERLTKAAGELGDYDPVTKFLLSYGPALATQKPTGGLLGTLSAAAAKPTEQLLLDRAKRAEEARNLRIAGEKAAIEQEGRMALLEKELLAKENIAKMQAEAIQKGTLTDQIEFNAKEYQGQGYGADESNRIARFDILTKPVLVESVGQAKVQDDPLDINITDPNIRKKYIEKNKDKAGTYFYSSKTNSIVKLEVNPKTGILDFIQTDKFGNPIEKIEPSVPVPTDVKKIKPEQTPSSGYLREGKPKEKDIPGYIDISGA